MAGRVNKYGLSDYIPAAVRRAVRQECGFGCVTCGLAVAQYDHVDPPFEEAREHAVDRIALLCGACHEKKTRGMWSVEKIAADRNEPIALTRGFAHDAFDLADPFVLAVGSSCFENVTSVVRCGSDRWFSIEGPECSGGPIRLSAIFYDADGHPSLSIERNEWRVMSDRWDAEAVGSTITIRKGHADIVLELNAVPPHRLELRRLKMGRWNTGIIVEPNGRVTFTHAGGSTVLDECLVEHADTVFSL